MSKQFWGVVIVIILIFVGIFAFGGNKSNGSGNKNSGSNLSQHVEGKGTSGVTLVEYGDYQCPYCEQYYPIVKESVAKFGDQIKFQFRNFPLTNAHPNAFAAARAAEAAALQSKFWEMHDALYDQNNWQQWTQAKNPNPYFEQYAKQIGINVTQFKTDFASSKVNDTVNADMAEGNRLGITGTPSFFIDGKEVKIDASPSAFEKTIQTAIDQKAASKTNQ